MQRMQMQARKARGQLSRGREYNQRHITHVFVNSTRLTRMVSADVLLGSRCWWSDDVRGVFR